MKKKVFLSFLMPYPIRSIEAPFLWVYYKQMSSLHEDEIIFIGSKEYRQDPKLLDENRYELKSSSAEHAGYNVPTLEKINAYRFYDFDNLIFTKLDQIHNHNTNQIFKRLLIERIEEVEQYLTNLFASITEEYDVTAILSWCNFPSLDYVVSKHDLRIIHNELGAFRKPYYQPTAYFDFSGVNGDTETKKRFEKFTDVVDKNLLLDLDAIRNTMFLVENIDAVEDEQFDVGVALQVEDDSNILAFSNGFDAISLLRWISDNYPNQSLSIREHPSGHLKYDKFGHIDTSANSIVFLLKCNTLITINSSVALEALLFEKQVKILGDSPFAFLMDVDESQRMMALNFAIFGYMIPYDYLYDRDYYLWRLGNPTENEIFERHLRYYKLKIIGSPKTTFQNILGSHLYVQLFLDHCDGFSEENSMKLPVAQNTDVQEFVFDLSGKPALTTLRFDPLNDSCVIEIEKLALVTDQGEIDLYEHIASNALIHHGNSYFFDHNDPQMYFNDFRLDKLDAKSLIAIIRFPHIGKDALEMCIKQLIRDKNHIIALKNSELDQTKASISWKITKPLRKMQQILKGTK